MCYPMQFTFKNNYQFTYKTTLSFSSTAKQPVNSKGTSHFRRPLTGFFPQPQAIFGRSSAEVSLSAVSDSYAGDHLLGKISQAVRGPFSTLRFISQDVPTRLASLHFGGFSVPTFEKRIGARFRSLSGQRISGIIYGFRSRKLARFDSLKLQQFKFMEKAHAPSRAWRFKLYSSIDWPASQAQATRYTVKARVRSAFTPNRYTIFTNGRARTGSFYEATPLPTGRSVVRSVPKLAIFVRPYSYRVRYELSKMRLAAVSSNRQFGANFAPTIKRYLERLWRIRFRLRFEKFFFKRTGCRTYVWLQSTFRGLRLSYRKRFGRVFGISNSDKNRKIAAHWRWSTYQMSIFYYAVYMMMTQPGNLELPFITLSRLMRRHREHFRVVRFFMGYIKRAMASRHVDNLFNFRLRLAGKFAGELKRRSVVVGSGEMRLARFKIPADFYTAQIVTKYGIFGLKFWVQVFPATSWFEQIMEPTLILDAADDIRGDDPEYPGWVYFGKDELLGQWFMRAMYESLKNRSSAAERREALEICSETHLAPEQLSKNFARFEELRQESANW